MKKIALAIPSYNCGTQLVRVLEKVNNSQHEKITTILIVDNQSSSENIELLKNFLLHYPLVSKVKFFQNQKNLGLGASFKRSWIYLKNSGYESMIFLHGDDQAELKDYFHFECQHSAPIAFGARFMKNSKIINYSKRRHWNNLFLNGALSVLVRKKIWELGSGLNAYKLDSISNDEIMMLSNHIAFDLELLIFCIKNNISFQFFPISWKSEDEISTINELGVGLDLLNIIFRYGIFNIWPINKSSEFPIEDGWREML